jgi:hypothetical protein
MQHLFITRKGITSMLYGTPEYLTTWVGLYLALYPDASVTYDLIGD